MKKKKKELPKELPKEQLPILIRSRKYPYDPKTWDEDKKNCKWIGGYKKGEPV